MTGLSQFEVNKDLKCKVENLKREDSKTVSAEMFDCRAVSLTKFWKWTKKCVAAVLLVLATFCLTKAVQAAVKEVSAVDLESICTSGTPQDLERILQESSADVVFPSGNRPIHIVAEHASDPEMVDILVKKGASLTAEGLEKLTPLMLAAAYNPHPRITEAILKAGSPVNSSDSQGRTPLSLAAASNSSPEVTAVLLRNGALPNVRDRSGRTPLWLAAARSAGQIVQLLLDSGAKVDEANTDGFTPLLVASEKPKAEVIRLLIEAGADVNIRGKNRYTPLMTAISVGAGAETANLFLEGRADVKAEDDQNRSAILLAAAREGTSPDVLKVLIEAGASPNALDSSLTTPLTEACRQKNVAAVRYLLSAGAKANMRDRNSWTPLMHAVAKGAPREIFELLIGSGADINETTRRGLTPLMIAIDSKAEPETLKNILDLGGNPNQQSLDTVTALMGAVGAEDAPSIKVLLERGADPNLGTWDGLTPLMLAAQRAENSDIFRILVDSGASVDQKNVEGLNPLMIAASVGNMEALQSLTALSADLEAKDLDGATPLVQSILSREEDLETIDFLIEAGVNVNTVDYTHATPLMQAALRGKEETAGRLLDAGADFKARDMVGWTPLHFAARTEDGSGIIQLLLEKGCPVDIPDSGGTTPLMVAASYNNTEAVRTLLAAGASFVIADNTGRSAYEYALLKNSTESKNLIEEAKSKNSKK